MGWCKAHNGSCFVSGRGWWNEIIANQRSCRYS
jgi:hypothetical protein